MVEVRIGDEHLTLTWNAWEQRVAEGRIPPDALVRFPPVTGDLWRHARDLGMYESAARSSADAFARVASRGTPPWMTALLLGAQIRIWGLAWLPGIRSWMDHTLTKWTSPVLEDGEVWRLLTMGGLHIAFSHILMNGVWLAYTGFHLERALGARNLAVLFFASVFGGSLFSLFGSPDVPSLGSSGGVFGLVAASVVFGLVRPELLPPRMRRTFGFALLPYLFLMLISGATSPGTDNWSHLGGALTGALLAVLADPPGMDRRDGWSARWQLTTLSLAGMILAGLAIAGPRIMPLRDHLVAARESQGLDGRIPQGLERPLLYDVPAGWRAGTLLDGTRGWRSATTRRGWRVRVVRHGRPRTADEVLSAQVADLRERVGGDIAIGLPPPLVIDGKELPGREAVAEAFGATWTWRTWVAPRGVETLVITWQVERTMEQRLRPLFERLTSAVHWSPPEALAALESRHGRYPNDRRTTRQLAELRAETGDGAGALALWQRRLADDRPTGEDAEGLLDTLRLYRDLVEDLDAVVDDVLTRDLGPRAVAAAARLYLERQRADLARGLVALAWLRQPGEYHLRTLVVELGLSEVLSEDGVPAWATWDPIADAPDSPPPSPEAPPNLAEAAAWGEAWAERRVILSERVTMSLREDRPLAALRALHLWRDGHLPQRPDVAARTAARTIRRAAPALGFDTEPFVAAVEATPEADVARVLSP